MVKDLSRMAPVIKSTSMVVLGTFVIAFGTGIFILPFELVGGGVSGFSIILHRAFAYIPFLGSISTEALASILNAFAFLLGALFLGKSFAMKTLVSTLVYPIALSLASTLAYSNVLGGFFNLLSDKYSEYGNIVLVLASVFGGAVIGCGCALTFLGGGSSGGTDIIALIFAKYLRIKSSRAIFIIDAIIIAVGTLAINNIVLSLLGIVFAFVCALTIDRLFLGSKSAFTANVVTNKYEEINRAVIEQLERTTTLIDCRGGYSGEDKKVVMVTFSMRQYADFMTIVSMIDKNAFITIGRAHEIGGEGWTYES